MATCTGLAGARHTTVSLRDRLEENWRGGAIGACGAALLGLVVLFSPWKSLTYLSYDAPFLLRSANKAGPAIIVYMDDLAVRSNKVLLDRFLPATETPSLWTPLQGPWHRALHAALVKELTRQGAQAIVFDILWDQPWTNYFQGLKSPSPFDFQVDGLLADAIRAHGKVVLAAEEKKIYDAKGRPVGYDVIFPTETLRAASPWRGVIQLPQERDGVIRRHYQSPNSTLSWAAAEAIGRAPPEGSGDRWLNYYGPPGKAIPWVSYFEVFQTGATPPGFFSNKVVFVGKGKWIDFTGSRSARDEFPSPYGRDVPGVEFQAAAFLNLIGHDWLEELDRLHQFLLILGFGALLGFGLVLVRPWVAFRISLAALLLVIAFSFLLLSRQRLWFPWLIPALVQVPAALAWAVVANSKKLYREKAALEQTLATAQSALQPAAAPPTARSHAALARPGGPDSPAGPTALQPAGAPGQPSGTPAIPDLTLLRKIGQGAYGEVWLAQDILGIYKAVKIVYRHDFSSASPFDREFRGLQKFTPISRSHPGFLNILHVGRNDEAGYFYAIMELGDDESTGQRIDVNTYSAKTLARLVRRRGHLPVQECLVLGVALTDALHFLHLQQLIHRDIKPSNIIFVRDQPKFADIGLVTDLGRNPGDATYLGTEGFIAPEGPGTAAADVYSLGKVLYEAGMGRDREQFPELPTTLTERPDPRALLELNDIILKACENDPAKRYQTAAEFQADLVRLSQTLNRTSAT